MEDAEEAGLSIKNGPPDPDEHEELLAQGEAVRREVEDDYRARMASGSIDDPRADRNLATAKEAAAERIGRGAKCRSERSRREMWRWVLSLPFDMLGERPLRITLTYPGDWRPWVPDEPTVERHRRAFGEAWNRWPKAVAPPDQGPARRVAITVPVVLLVGFAR